MRAVICDACGATYRPYNTGKDVIRANGMTFVYFDKIGKMHNKGKLELCPDCMDKVKDFVLNELCPEDSPFVEKAKAFNERFDAEEAAKKAAQTAEE